MNNDFISNILMMVATVAMVIFMFGCLGAIIKLIKLNRKYIADGAELAHLKESNNVKVIEYSKQVLEFIRMMVSQVAIIKFRTFIDNNDITKVTKSHIEKLASQVATSVKYSINIGNISLSDTIYTQEYFDEYIVETSILMVKQLFEKAIGDIDE